MPIDLGIAARLALAAVLMITAVARAQLQPVWQVGKDDDPLAPGYAPTAEFSQENYQNDPRPGRVTRLPGDPLYNAGNNPGRDDDFYLAGLYPAGFNGLTTNLPVAFNEPDLAWERAMTDGDRTNRVHFFLTSSEAGATARLRLSFELIWGGIWLSQLGQSGEGFGSHDVVVRFRNATGQGTLLYSNRVERDTRIVLDFSAVDVHASVGPNTLEFVRVGPFTANTGYWIQFDYVQLAADSTARMDADGDGLPRWWEDDNGLSDEVPSDAASDRDGDGLTALQEYNGGVNPTNPNRHDTDGDGLTDGEERLLGADPNQADTDGDSLTDGDEVNGWPPSNPLLVDSDGDGTLDALERRLGTDPMSAASVPTVFRGGIGLNFVSEADRDGVLGTNEVAGRVPQVWWNNTRALRTWSRPSGSKADILTPLTNQVMRSDGLILTNFTFSWTGDATDASRNRGSSDRKLMSGFLRAYGDTPLVLTLSNIPFASYDLYVVVGGSYDGQRGRIRLDNDPTSDRFFETITTAPQAALVELKSGLAGYQRGNLVRYTNLNASATTLTLTNVSGWAVGIHAVQIVDRLLDADASGIPDWWEMQHALQPGSAARAATDTDGDGLTHSQEFLLGTDPRNPDTDGDGFTDSEEVALATNPLNADTDGDGLSDYAELRASIPSNPVLADTDGDGVNDGEERWRGSEPTYDPASSPTFVGDVPFFRSSPSRWEWNLENVQLVWDHGAGALAPNIWNEDQLISFAVRNPATADWRSLGMELRHYRGALTHLFHSEPTGAFSTSGQPNTGIWESDYGNPPADLKAKLGFSGYGPADISDRLQFRLFAQRGVNSNQWSLTFEIRNQTSNTVVVSRTFNNCTARPVWITARLRGPITVA